MRILLVGGGSGTGKTVLAKRLASQLGMPLSLADDFRLFAQRITSASQLPDLHFFVDEGYLTRRSSMGAEEQRDRLLALAGTVSRGLEVVIAHHLALEAPLIIEGDGITPSLAGARDFVGVPNAGRVGALFLHEPDPEQVLSNMLARGRGIGDLGAEDQSRAARLAWLYGAAVADEAARSGLMVLPSRPFETVFERALAAIYALERSTSSP